jgi:uncharacterized membrane protein HdeD (DUF308 family)
VIASPPLLQPPPCNHPKQIRHQFPDVAITCILIPSVGSSLIETPESDKHLDGGKTMAQDRLTTLGSGGSIAWAILLIGFGFLAIALPLGTSLGVILVVSWLIILSGGFQFIHAFQSKGAGSIAWKLLVAVVYLIAGLYFLLHPLLGLASFTLALAFFFVAEGVVDLIAYFQNSSAAGSGWILLDGIVTLLLGILVWRHWPSTSGWVIGTLVGISMLMTGTTRLMLSLAARRFLSISDRRQVIDNAA